jgi:hypothetical protein
MAAGAADDWQEYRQQPPYRYAALQKTPALTGD